MSKPLVNLVYAKLRDVINTNGWAVTGISDGSSRCAIPGCTNRHTGAATGHGRLYTCGLTDAGLPELLAEDMPDRKATAILNEMARQALATRGGLVPGQRYEAGGGAFTVQPVAAREGLRLCGMANLLYGHVLRVQRVLPF